MTENGTQGKILEVSRRIITESGLTGLTFDAVARRLGVSKQAVIYWYPTKQDLMRALVLPWVRAEADAVVTVVGDAVTAQDAIARTVRTLVRFHMDDLDRFRQMYMAIQLDPKPQLLWSRVVLDKYVHPVTNRMYEALEEALERDPTFRPTLSARRVAVSVHLAALGLVSMVALCEAVDDPLAHATDDLVATLSDLLGVGASATDPGSSAGGYSRG